MAASRCVRTLALWATASLAACALRHDVAPTQPCGSEVASQIRWWGPAAAKDRASIDARCRTVGDAVVVSRPAVQFTAPAPGDSLAIINWNVASGAADVLSLLQDDVGLTCAGGDSRPGDRFRHIVLLFQEAQRRDDHLPPLNNPGLAGTPSSHGPPREDALDVPALAARCGLAVAYVPSARDGADRPGHPRMDKGNAILSTLPLAGLAAMEIPYETERKVALAADLPLPDGGSLRVVAAHLEVTSSFRRTLFSGNQARARQALGLLEALDSLERGDGTAPPTVVGGDFNAWSGFETALRLFRVAMPDSPRWEGVSTRGPFPTDHIFFRLGSDPEPGVTLLAGSYRRMDVQYGSDHEPLIVWLGLEGHPTSR